MKKILIILPGWGGSHETWKDFIALAEKDFQVFCIDLPCFGIEPCPAKVWGVEEYADFVITNIKKISDKPVILLGHSFGGQIATYITANHPEIVFSLILMGAAALRPKHTLRRAFFFVVAKCGTLVFSLPGLKKLHDLAKKILYKGADSSDYGETSGIKRDIFKKVIRQDLGHLLPRISIPTLLLWGKNDSYVSVSLAKKIHTLIPQSKLEIIKDGRHGIHHTHGDVVLEHIRSFISSV